MASLPPCPHEVSVKVPLLSHSLSPFLNTGPSHPPTTNSQASKRPREARALPEAWLGITWACLGSSGLALALMKAVTGAPRGGGRARIGCTTCMPSPPPPLPRCLGTGANSVQTAHLGISAHGEGMQGSDLSSSLPTWNPETRYGVKTGLGHSPLESESGGLSLQGLIQELVCPEQALT